MIFLMKKIGKTKTAEIQNIIDYIKKLKPEYTKNFKIVIQKWFEQDVSQIVQKLFPWSNTNTYFADNTIKIYWEWLYYNRSLDLDLDHLLSK